MTAGQDPHRDVGRPPRRGVVLADGDGHDRPRLVVADAVRRGKYLWMPLAGSDGVAVDAMVVHLGMSGQMLIARAGAPDHTHLRIRAALDDGNELRFVDQRTFGHLTVVDLVPTADRPAGVAERRRRAYFAQVAARAATSSTPAAAIGWVPTQRAPQHDRVTRPTRSHATV